MNKLLFCSLCIFCCFIANSQSATDSVKTVVNTLFSAMKKADGQLLKTCFSDNAVLQTITDEKGTVKNEAVADFVISISKLPAGDADERIVFGVVKVDETLAIVWAPYQFFYKGVFSHCGVDSFQLVRINGQWKIQYLVDTRRQGGCL